MVSIYKQPSHIIICEQNMNELITNPAIYGTAAVVVLSVFGYVFHAIKNTPPKKRAQIVIELKQRRFSTLSDTIFIEKHGPSTVFGLISMVVSVATAFAVAGLVYAVIGGLQDSPEAYYTTFAVLVFSGGAAARKVHKFFAETEKHLDPPERDSSRWERLSESMGKAVAKVKNLLSRRSATDDTPDDQPQTTSTEGQSTEYEGGTAEREKVKEV